MYSSSGGVANGGRVHNPRPDPAEVGPPRRVNRDESHVGEHIASSKRRIAWTFTLGDADTVHEVVLAHSIMSYKKTVEFDGRQMHFSSTATPGDWAYTMFLDGTKYAIEVRINDLESADVPKYDLVIDRVPYRRWDVYRRRKQMTTASGTYGQPYQQAQQAPGGQTGGSFGAHRWGPSGMTAPPPMEPSPPRGAQQSHANTNAFRRDGSYQSPAQQHQQYTGAPPPRAAATAAPPATAATAPAQRKPQPKEIDLLGDFGASEVTTVSAQQLIFDPLASSRMGGAPPAPSMPNSQYAAARTSSNPTMPQATAYGAAPMQQQQQQQQPNARTTSNPSMTQAYIDPFANTAQSSPMQPTAMSMNLDPFASQNSSYMQQNRQIPATAVAAPSMGMPAYSSGYHPQQQQQQQPGMARGMPHGMPMQPGSGYPTPAGGGGAYPPSQPGAVNYNISHLMNPMELNTNARNPPQGKSINIDPFAGMGK